MYFEHLANNNESKSLSDVFYIGKALYLVYIINYTAFIGVKRIPRTTDNANYPRTNWSKDIGRKTKDFGFKAQGLTSLPMDYNTYCH